MLFVVKELSFAEILKLFSMSFLFVLINELSEFYLQPVHHTIALLNLR